MRSKEELLQLKAQGQQPSPPERFWAEVTGVDASRFKKPTLKRHNPKTIRKNVGDGYHGCLVVGVLRGAELYLKIEGWALGAVGGASSSS